MEVHERIFRLPQSGRSNDSELLSKRGGTAKLRKNPYLQWDFPPFFLPKWLAFRYFVGRYSKRPPVALLLCNRPNNPKKSMKQFPSLLMAVVCGSWLCSACGSGDKDAQQADSTVVVAAQQTNQPQTNVRCPELLDTLRIGARF